MLDFIDGRNMEKVDLFELATYCQEKYKEAHNMKDNQYVKTLFVAITSEGGVVTSTTPHMLRNAEQCILIHERSELAYTNSYSWYDVDYINEKGAVYNNRFDEVFELCVRPFNGFSNQVMRLQYDDKTIYSCERPWEKSIAKVWKLYSRVKDMKSSAEINLIAELFKKDEKILDLERQIEDFKYTKQLLEQQSNQYKSLLDEIKSLLGNK